MTYRYVRADELYHHGVKGMRWGHRKNKYENSDGSLTKKGIKRQQKRQAELENLKNRTEFLKVREPAVKNSIKDLKENGYNSKIFREEYKLAREFEDRPNKKEIMDELIDRYNNSHYQIKQELRNNDIKTQRLNSAKISDNTYLEKASENGKRFYASWLAGTIATVTLSQVARRNGVINGKQAVKAMFLGTSLTSVLSLYRYDKRDRKIANEEKIGGGHTWY